jgi:hypothetical protein
MTPSDRWQRFERKGADVRKPIIAVIVFGLLSLACSETSQGTSQSRGHGPLRAFLGEMRASDFDYEPADTPADLARQADVVVTGSIVDVRPGQSYAENGSEKAVVATSVLWVQVDDVISGNAELMTDGVAFVEIAHPAYVGTGKEDGKEIPFDQEAFASNVPRTTGLFFLTDRSEEPYLPKIIDEGSGRLPDSRITTPFIQGFLIQLEGRLVSVLEPLNAMPRAWQTLGSVQDVLDEV